MERFAVFDIDGTLIRWQLYHVVVHRLAKEGYLGKDAQKIIKQGLSSWKDRQHDNSFKDYEHQLVKLYEQKLPNIKLDVFDKIIDNIFEEYKDQTYLYTRNLITKLKNQNYKLFIVSGSHIELIDKIGKYYGFDDWVGMQYERSKKGFTGKILTNSLDKNWALKELITRNNVSIKNSIAIGDTKGDIPMLRLVDEAIAFNPNQALYDEATKNGWKIVVERKNMIYELTKQGSQYYLKIS